MRPYRRWRLIGAGLVIALLSAGCSSGAASDSAGTGRSGTLTIAFSSATQTQDPATSASPLYDFPAYDSLIYQAPDGGYEPDLATSWGYVGSGNTTFQLTLRKGVRFSDGSAMTPAAVAASLNRYLAANKGSPITGPVSSVTVSGPDQVELHYSSSVPYAFAAWSLTPAVGFGMIVGPHGLADTKALSTYTDGVGPYVFDAAESVSGGNQVYLPDKYYFNQAAIRYSKVVIEPITSNSSELAAAQSGQVLVDVNLAAAQMSTARSAGMEIVTQPAGDADDLILEKTTSGPLANPEVRQAIEYAMPRSEILSAVFAGAGTATSSNSQAGFAGYDPADVGLYPYDVAKAKQLMASAGYASGFSLSVLTGLGTTPTFAEAIAVALKAIGITASITDNTGGFPQFAAAAETKNYTALVLTTPAQSIYTTLKSAMLPGQTENLWGATDSALNADLTAAATGSTVATQDTALQTVTSQLDHLAWIVPVSVTASYAAVAAGLHNVPSTNRSQLIVADPFAPDASQAWYGS
ncbi:MAG: ABC transporter substrate-binding protein [Streptosporangiaceae bacterium]|jgi:peptide/nickel transport system substrate-binding protein